MILMTHLVSLSMKLQKPSSALSEPSYRERYDYMFNIVRFGTTKEITDHIMFQREMIESQRAEIREHIESRIMASYKWISVKEKLPEKNTYVLMAATSGYVGTTFYTEPKIRKIDCKVSAWFEHANNYAYEVTHWMPLPKAPQEQGDDI